MKRREHLGEAEWAARTREFLAEALSAISDPAEMSAFLDDLCTPAELEALADRWAVVPLLAHGTPYRQIHEETGVSVTTIGRVARCWEHGAGGYRAALSRHTGGAQPATG
ncbi:YerC/YecD family TrpR-related protein [Ornithinicoccus hortensis]|uniref:Trp operon repressor family n=1 Tax=Ornithinicoccus hortensis TaxID=82346 RepID=A0A542YTC3_9MICO|nr:YerC/YecD family TrpR-related protein [Ornithinicoccus hortensis]TQL51301.1 Trp operon repressor family [Ornithinicoccus hortensis]